MRFLALGDADGAGGEDFERGGRGNGQAAMRAINPAGAVHDGRGEDPRPAEEFEGDAAADDINNGVQRAHFVEMNFLGGHAVNLPFGRGDALEDLHRFVLHPVGKRALENERLDLGEVAGGRMRGVVRVSVGVGMTVPMVVLVAVVVIVIVVMIMMMLMGVAVIMAMVMAEMHIELETGDRGFLAAGRVQVIILERKFPQFALELGEVRPQVEQGAHKHVAADAAGNVEIEGLHGRDARRSGRAAEAVDLAGGVTGAETVVNVHHGDAAAATVEHPQERGEAAEARPVAHAGGHRDDRLGHESRHHAGQRAFHAGHHNHHVRILKGVQAADETVESGDADVVDPRDPVAHDFGGDGRLFGHGQVAGARADDGDGARLLAQGREFDGDAARDFVMDGAPEFLAQGARVVRGDARDQDALFVVKKFGGDTHNLRGSLAGAVNDLREALAEGAVGVHAGKGELGDGRGLKGAKDFVAAHGAGAKLLEQPDGIGCRHAKSIAGKGGPVTQEK